VLFSHDFIANLASFSSKDSRTSGKVSIFSPLPFHLLQIVSCIKSKVRQMLRCSSLLLLPKKKVAPVASFVKDYITEHPKVASQRIDQRLAIVNEAWEKLSTAKQQDYLANPLRGLRPPKK
jgi:hypothetical protein